MQPVSSAAAVRMQVAGRESTVFCSNNYLGLANHPAIIAAIKNALDQWGFGSGASRLICGHTQAHEHLQVRLAQMLHKEASLVLPSGFVTNLAVLSTIPQEGDLIVIDKLAHASIIDGAQASAATVRVWPHGQLAKLRRLLDRGDYRHAFIVSDSLFSMDGDWALLQELVDIKRHYQAHLMLDEAHAFGCVGPDGAGYAAQAGLLDDVDIFVATFSKALGGAGGFVGCSQILADYIVNKARPFIFTTATPTINCIAAEAALDIIAAEPARRQRLCDNGDYLRRCCQQLGLDTGSSQSYIVPIILKDAHHTVAAAQQLAQQGLIVWPIRPPTVKKGASRLRLSLSSEHTRADIDTLCAALEKTLPPA